MFVRRRSRKDRMMTAAGHLIRSRRALAMAAGVVSSVVALAASSSVSAKRQKQT
jgi:hypothetical protein